MPEKLCFLCERLLENNNRINRNSLTLAYMQNQIAFRFEKFKLKVGDNISNYHPALIHLTCYDKVKKELDALCGE
jgi:hypothetical protein